jgi:hypothetical protein
LVAKRSELAGLLAHHQQAIQQLTVSISGLDGTIKLFDPDYDLRTIKSKAPRQSNTWFPRGEVGRMILDVLRKSGIPISTRQIGDELVTTQAIDVPDAEDLHAIMKLVLAAAKRLERKGVIKMVGRNAGSGGGAMLWQIA